MCIHIYTRIPSSGFCLQHDKSRLTKKTVFFQKEKIFCPAELMTAGIDQHRKSRAFQGVVSLAVIPVYHSLIYTSFTKKTLFKKTQKTFPVLCFAQNKVVLFVENNVCMCMCMCIHIHIKSASRIREADFDSDLSKCLYTNILFIDPEFRP